MTTDNKSIMCFNLSYMFGEKEIMKEVLDELFQWIGDGTIRVPTITEFKMRDVASAHRAIESGNSFGKLVLLTQEEEKNEDNQVKSTEQGNQHDSEVRESLELLRKS